MPKSYVESFLSFYREVLADFVSKYPDYRRGAERDLSRLQTALASRGLKVITLDLPALGKALDKSLAEGSLNLESLPFSKGRGRACVLPRLFWGMYNRIFKADGSLRDSVSAQDILFLRTVLYTGKKFKMDCGDSERHSAVREFYEIDNRVLRPTLVWDEDEFDVLSARDLSLSDTYYEEHSLFPEESEHATLHADCDLGHIADGIQLVADITSAELGEFRAEDQSYKHGPGAVADQDRWGNKFLFPTWPAKLERAFPLADVGFPNYGVWASAILSPDVDYGLKDQCHPSELIAVPKTQKGPRLIAKEPIAHQWCQQGILHFFSEGVGRVSIGSAIRFNDQTPNQQAALRASHTGESWTIDLSSASDRMSCYVVERMWRMNPSLLTALHSSRTRWIVNNIDKKSPRYHKIRKFSTQGSAVTFPMQTYVYAIIAIGTLLSVRKVPINMKTIRAAAKEVQVFGDDIVVPSDVGSFVVRMIEYLGFKVNTSKTFGTGKFRESCGIDAWDGQVVTVPYLTQLPQKDKPSSLVATVQLAWNFLNKGFYHAASWLQLDTLTEDNRFRFLRESPIDDGSLCWPPLKGSDKLSEVRRVHPDLQVAVRKSLVLKSTRRTSETQGSTGLMRFFTSSPGPDIIWSSGVDLRPKSSLKLRWEPIR